MPVFSRWRCKGGFSAPLHEVVGGEFVDVYVYVHVDVVVVVVVLGGWHES